MNRVRNDDLIFLSVLVLSRLRRCSCSVACDGARARSSNRLTQFLTIPSITSTASLSTSTWRYRKGTTRCRDRTSRRTFSTPTRTQRSRTRTRSRERSHQVGVRVPAKRLSTITVTNRVANTAKNATADCLSPRCLEAWRPRLEKKSVPSSLHR